MDFDYENKPKAFEAFKSKIIAKLTSKNDYYET